MFRLKTSWCYCPWEFLKIYYIKGPLLIFLFLWIFLPGPSPLNSYEMNRNPRGKCIIVNNFQFGKRNIETLYRHGTHFDEDALETLFRGLSFDVETHRNLELHQLKKLVKEAAEEKLEKSDAFFFIMMSHGADQDKLVCQDLRTVSVEDIMVEFTAEWCKTLAKKPKVFIFQACRGSHYEVRGQEGRGVDNILTDSTLPRGTSPREADFLLAYATTPGYYSFRDPNNGSPFIQVRMTMFIYAFYCCCYCYFHYCYYIIIIIIIIINFLFCYV